MNTGSLASQITKKKHKVVDSMQSKFKTKF